MLVLVPINQEKTCTTYKYCCSSYSRSTLIGASPDCQRSRIRRADDLLNLSMAHVVGLLNSEVRIVGRVPNTSGSYESSVVWQTTQPLNERRDDAWLFYVTDITGLLPLKRAVHRISEEMHKKALLFASVFFLALFACLRYSMNLRPLARHRIRHSPQSRDRTSAEVINTTNGTRL